MNNTKVISLSEEEKLDALCWAAKQKECTYGQLSARLTSGEREDIYERYGMLLTKQYAEERRRVEAANTFLRSVGKNSR